MLDEEKNLARSTETRSIIKELQDELAGCKHRAFSYFSMTHILVCSPSSDRSSARQTAPYELPDNRMPRTYQRARGRKKRSTEEFIARSRRRETTIPITTECR